MLNITKQGKVFVATGSYSVSSHLLIRSRFDDTCKLIT